jgi:hypothetical protein
MEWLPGLTSPLLLASADSGAGLFPDQAAGAESLRKRDARQPDSVRAGQLEAAGASGASAGSDLAPALSDEQVRNFLLDWKAAWEKADLESYAGFYAKNAVQAGVDLKRMLPAKRKLWERAQPLEIVFDSINITRTKRGIKISLLQSYTDTKGYSDRGIKTLLLESSGGTPRIAREDWKPEKK